MNKRPTIEEVYNRPECFDAVWSESIEYYGVTKQSVTCMEECAELIEAYDDRKRDGLTDATRSHMVEEMADVLICLWLLERMYDVRDRDSRTRHPSPVGACVALIKAGQQDSALRHRRGASGWACRRDGRRAALADSARKRKRHYERGTGRHDRIQDKPSGETHARDV